LSSYLQAFVDSQFYGIELFPLHVALDVDKARKIFLCSCFELPTSTATALTYALLPVMPPLFMMLKRRATFYRRALVHDLSCVREAFLFDMCHLYPHKSSWTFQLVQMLKSIDVDILHDISSFPRHLEEFDDVMKDVNLICFHRIRFSEEQTLSFFRSMPDVSVAVSFRLFLSSCSIKEQNFFILFFSSGLRWRFFCESRRGSCCPFCRDSFWSWEHFLSCQLQPVRVSVPEITAMTVLCAWREIAQHAKRVTLIWLSNFPAHELQLKSDEIMTLF
jgi:hypothetical protein